MQIVMPGTRHSGSLIVTSAGIWGWEEDPVVRNDQFLPKSSFCERNVTVAKLFHVYSCPFLVGTLLPAPLWRLPVGGRGAGGPAVPAGL